MRLNEFASAQDQIALWRLVSDSVWASISLQAEQERKQRAEKAAQSKYKGTRSKKSSKVAKPAAPISQPIANKPMLSRKPQPIAPTNPQAAKMQQAVTSTRNVKQPLAQPQQQFGKAVPAAVQTTTPNTVQNPSSVSKPAANAQTTAVVAQPLDGTDRYSANGYRAQPVQPARTTARGAISR